MTSHEKLRARVKSCPSDLTWNELTRLLGALGYDERTGAGSRRKFRGEGLPALNLHAPHPGKIVKAYMVREVVGILEGEGLL
jgi:hypothetical protein